MEVHVITSLVILIVQYVEISVSSEEFLNINDILSEDLMPGSFLDIMDKDQQLGNLPDKMRNKSSVDSIKWNNGSFNIAFSTMNFHRKMMNEYLCRNFLAEEILSELEVDIPPKQDRHGRPFSLPSPIIDLKQRPLSEKTDVKNVLLADAGSSSYKDWLSKTATLEDIYRHVQRTNDATKGIIPRNDADGFAKKDFIAAEGVEYDGGDITGYAYNNPIPAPAFSGKVGYEHQPGAAAAESYEEHSGHSMGLSDLFEISLTGLAFLSFGMFALQVIMCMTMNNQTIVMQSMVNQGDENDDVMNIDEVRRRRSAPESRAWLGAETLNEMSRRVLLSIEAVMLSSHDEGACLKRSICESNKYSRSLNDEQKFWIPLWNVGISWAGSGWGAGSGSLRAMDGLRAAALGLGGARCRPAFPTCNYTELHQTIQQRRFTP